MSENPSHEEEGNHATAEARSGEGTASIVLQLQRRAQTRIPVLAADHGGDDQPEDAKGK